ncbi:DNA-directed DNA polymerase [Yamadazyma tenuis]|uniref:Histone-fold-containing protein n=1 Tax=Candida tenuis (strain ATCC 10573 / BCRC 21748 / CBS 615 / JCM 9827 / NBRC 10315 / NRRL Y-1498 / VKM Y-70) TaxID=590646 RepID=G3AZE3_CANTC|nr:histone-fold-containing protein [Yamadazyma tenuis ATCC 10573]EGV66074.1 histone-fold-containing protein [Yamadazyma tenuis ATCC 10573]WEJ95577.1 DNA-directed DNA polymerase [Yamadazyma tenuis]
MSSPPPDSQGRMNDTPTTTPPAPTSDIESPAPEPQQMDLDPKSDSDDDSASISLPLSKIKRIFKMDPDYSGASQSAVFATGAATELFVQYITEQASLLAKIDKRKKILYKDFSTAVTSQDSLNFLSDTIPKTVPLRAVLQDQGTVEHEITPQTAPTPTPEQTDRVELPPTRRIDITSMLPVVSGPPPVQQQSTSPPVNKPSINSLISNDSPSNSDDVIMID